MRSLPATSIAPSTALTEANAHLRRRKLGSPVVCSALCPRPLAPRLRPSRSPHFQELLHDERNEHSGILREPAASGDRHADEVARGERFEFGKNWTRFLAVVDDERVEQAERSLSEMLGRPSIGRRPVPGHRLGQRAVQSRRQAAWRGRCISFDYDPYSVACTRELKARYRPERPRLARRAGLGARPRVHPSFGRFDVVYSWGVLHHTGAMWEASTGAAGRRENGKLFIAIYNDTGSQSARWKQIKHTIRDCPSR